MRITDLEIDGFGVWNSLQLANLSRQVTVFYGPNEAGKTTVMQFIRTVLYGVTPERRRRYLPPVEGGRPGGLLGITEGDLPFSRQPLRRSRAQTTSAASSARRPWRRRRRSNFCSKPFRTLTRRYSPTSLPSH